MKTTYYKVVAIERKNKKVIRRSFLHKRLNGCVPANIVVTYQFGKPTSPQVEGTKLMVFDDKRQALQFQDGDKQLQVWECEVTNPTPVYYVGRFEEIMKIDPTLLREMWEDIMKYDQAKFELYNFLSRLEREERASWQLLGSAPGHTFACDSVTLTKQVKE